MTATKLPSANNTAIEKWRKKHILREMHFAHFFCISSENFLVKILLKTAMCKVKMDTGERESF